MIWHTFIRVKCTILPRTREKVMTGNIAFKEKSSHCETMSIVNLIAIIVIKTQTISCSLRVLKIFRKLTNKDTRLTAQMTKNYGACWQQWSLTSMIPSPLSFIMKIKHIIIL